MRLSQGLSLSVFVMILSCTSAKDNSGNKLKNDSVERKAGDLVDADPDPDAEGNGGLDDGGLEEGGVKPEISQPVIVPELEGETEAALVQELTGHWTSCVNDGNSVYELENFVIRDAKNGEVYTEFFVDEKCSERLSPDNVAELAARFKKTVQHYEPYVNAAKFAHKNFTYLADSSKGTFTLREESRIVSRKFSKSESTLTFESFCGESLFLTKPQPQKTCESVYSKVK